MAYIHKIPILFDAEDYEFQTYFDTIALEMMKKFNKDRAIVYNTLQMYRIDRLSYLDELTKIGRTEQFYIGIKLVRGAYMEKERERAKQLNYSSPIHINKSITDSDFNNALQLMVTHIDILSIFSGTHNEESTLLLMQAMSEQNIANNDPRIYFSQLYGMSDNLSYNLANHGYNVAKYVPFGPVKNVVPYLLRRARENSSVVGQSNRELKLVTAEIERRKNETG